MSPMNAAIFVLTLIFMLVMSYKISGRRGLVGCSIGIVIALVGTTILTILEKMA